MEALTPVMIVDIVRTVVMPVSESRIQCMDVILRTVTGERLFKTFFLFKLNIYSDQFTLHSKFTFNYIHAFPGNQTHDLRIVCTFQTETTLNNFSLT